MGRSRYKILDEKYPYFITSSVVNKSPAFKKPEFLRIIIDGLNFLVAERKIIIYAYVIMPDHLHLVVKGKDLSKHISSFKSYSARRILDTLEGHKLHTDLSVFKKAKRTFKRDRAHQFWTEGFHPKQIFSVKMMEQKINYIHLNPVKAGLVVYEHDWLYSSYNDYYGNSKGLVKIKLFDG